MISQQQNNIHVNEEDTQPPLDQEHAARSASPWRSWSLWLPVLDSCLRILGLVLPLAVVYSEAAKPKLIEVKVKEGAGTRLEAAVSGDKGLSGGDTISR